MASAVAVVAAIAVGGATRLTESGLSITEWKPVTGVLPPLTATAWDEAYRRYLLIPEAQTVHAGIAMHEFRRLFWWEWAHRLVARGVGLVIAVPFFVLWSRRRIRQGLVARLVLLPVLVAAQGALGWYMVSSGLVGRTSVSPYRLVAHLGLALLIFLIAAWTAVVLWRTSNSSSPTRHPTPAAGAFTLGVITMVTITMLSGGFVAGLDAGRIFNEFPLMGGRVVPVGYGAMSGMANIFENPIAVQFNHRLLALATAGATLLLWLNGERRRWPPALRRWTRASAVVASVQLGLGIATLLLAVPVSVAVAHQMGAVALLSTLMMAHSEAVDARLTS